MLLLLTAIICIVIPIYSIFGLQRLFVVPYLVLLFLYSVYEYDYY